MAKKNRQKIKRWVRRISLAMGVLVAVMCVAGVGKNGDNMVLAKSGCPDVKVIFARGSGGERFTSGHYLAFKNALETKLKTTNLNYEFDDLDYPAVSIDIGDGHLGTLLGAYIGGGDAYEFGDSVHAGTARLVDDINNDTCKNTKYVLGGYSQGAVVLLNGLSQIDSNRIIYIATFGDPKIYLPEGAGFVPPACSGKNLSEYRVYVPDCRAHKGILGAREPYVINEYQGKVGTWCNKYDILCSSHFSIKSHTGYAEDGLYEDASRFIFSKIGAEFGITNQYTSPHDTAILIDSTDSMENLIADYKAEALRLAKKTLDAGGRVALYDYRDLSDKYTPVQRCSFETCTLETFEKGLDEIDTYAGGDAPESLLSASFQVMKELNWNIGSTKSLVILTDDGYHSPDLDGTTFYDVQKLSKQIDPVNFYIITREFKTELYTTLAEATGGAVASTLDDLGLLTDTIMERYDSLPKVEEEYEDEKRDVALPVIEISGVEWVAQDSVRVSYNNSGEMAVVILNDGILGLTQEKEFTITGLKSGVKNILTLVPVSNEWRGEAVTIDFNDNIGMNSSERKDSMMDFVIPKAPDTSVAKK